MIVPIITTTSRSAVGPAPVGERPRYLRLERFCNTDPYLADQTTFYAWILLRGAQFMLGRLCSSELREIHRHNFRGRKLSPFECLEGL